MREVLWNVKAHTTDVKDLSRAAIATQDQIYLWTGYLKSLGIRFVRTGNVLRFTRGGSALQVPIRDHASLGGNQVWHRKDGYYLPVAIVQKLATGVRKLPDAHTIDLNVLPPARGSLNQNPARSASTPRTTPNH